MIMMIRSLIFGLSTVVCLIAHNATAQSQSAEEVWKVALSQQLRDERKCELKDFLTVRRFKFAGDDVLEGRISCFDGREFDFTRPQPHAKFKLRLCMPTAC